MSIAPSPSQDPTTDSQQALALQGVDPEVVSSFVKWYAHIYREGGIPVQGHPMRVLYEHLVSVLDPTS